MTDFEHGVGVGMLLAAQQGGNAGKLRGVIDDNVGVMKVVTENNGAYTDGVYTYMLTEYSKEITTQHTSGDTTTTTTEKFTQRIITHVYNNADGKLIMRTDYDETTGVINGYYDGDDLPIYLEEWRV